MSNAALAMVLAAAVLHASWNAIVKAAAEDRALTMAVVALAHALVGVVAIFFTPTPEPAAWPFLFGSSLAHYSYFSFLFVSYRYGDLSHVYPIARGVAPMLVAIGALIFAGETLTPMAWGGVVAVSLGIGLLAIGRNGAGADRAALLSALATGVMIATYSVVDGMGIRRSEAPFGYIAWILLLQFPLAFGFLALRSEPIRTVSRRAVVIALGGGLLSVLAYGLVLYAATLTALGAISAVRESSVIIAALIGVVLFGERPWGRRIIAAMVVASGVILLAVAG